MHHDSMTYGVVAVAADGYELSHWQVVGRASNNPNDVYNKVVDVRSLINIDLNFQKANGIKSPLVYLVAHFKPVGEPDSDSAEEPEVVTDEDVQPPHEPSWTDNTVTKAQALAALETVRRFVEGL